MLVLLFLLLILLSDQIREINEQLEQSIPPDTVEHEATMLLVQTAESLKQRGLIEQDESLLELTEKLTFASEDVVQQTMDLDAAEKIERLRAENRKLAKEQSSSDNELSELNEEVERLSEQIDALNEELTEAKRVEEDSSAARELLEQVEKSKLSMEDAKVCLSDCASDSGQGATACWGENLNNPDFIYHLGIGDAGVFVVPVLESIGKNAIDWTQIPKVARIEKSTYLRNAEFRKRFRKLKEYADSNNCVYQVYFSDVDTSSKSSFKSQEDLILGFVYRSSNEVPWDYDLTQFVDSPVQTSYEIDVDQAESRGETEVDESNNSIDTSSSQIREASAPSDVRSPDQQQRQKFTDSTRSVAEVGSQVVQEAVLLKSVKPRYPQYALNRGREGVCVVTFDISVDGKVENARAVKDQCNSAFRSASESAVSQRLYQPKTINGVPVRSSGRVSFPFKLR